MLVMVMTAVIALFMKTVVFETFEEEIDKRALSIGRHFAELAAEAYLTDSTSVLKTHLADYIATESYLSYIIIHDSNGRVLAHTFANAIPADILASLSRRGNQKAPYLFTSADGVKLEDFQIPIGVGSEGDVHIGIYEAKIEGEIQSLLGRLVPLVAVVLALAIIGAFILATAIMRPVSVLMEGVRRVTRGNLDVVIDTRSRDEIGHLAQAFNQMTANLRQTTVSRTFMENVINTMNDMLLLISPEGLIQDANQAFLNLFEYDLNDLVGRSLDNFAGRGSDCCFSSAFADVLEKDSVAGIEAEGYTKSGRCVQLLFSMAVMNDSAGQPLTVICAAQDISAIKSVQERLQHKQAELEELNQKLEGLVSSRTAELAITNEGLRAEVAERQRTADELLVAKNVAEAASQAKTEFLANMSHEMRTPLNSIIGGTEYLEVATLSPDQQRCLDMIRHAGDGLLVQVNDLIDLARIEAGHLELMPKEFNLGDTLESIVQMLLRSAQNKKISLDLKVPPDIPHFLVGDQGRLKQVLVNLVSNAIKFTGYGGSVRLSAQPVECDTHVAEIRFVVRDTGIGIAAGKLGMIFESFAQADSSITRSYGGSGLGLAISRRLVKAMGGSFQVESVPGVGSSFGFSIRFQRALQPIVSQPDCQDGAEPGTTGFDSETSDVLHGRSRLLLVDDSQENRELMRLLLGSQPLDMDEAVNGQEALELFGQNAYDIVLMDIQMPVMDGYTATRMMRQIEEQSNSKHTPIIALTAHAYEADIRKCSEAGCDDHIAKPFKKKVLLKSLARHIRGIEHG
jgi:Amt family ammonium transporter